MDFNFTFKKKPEGTGAPKPPEAHPAQAQFDQLRGCGINLRGHSTLDQLVAGVDPAAFADPPFVQLLCAMGGLTEEGEAWSDEVWMWPAACVGEDGVLTVLVSHLARLCRGALPVEDVADAINAESGEVAIAFTLDGERVEWSVPLMDGEPEGGLLTSLAAVAAERGDGARLAALELEGAGRLLVFMTEPEIAELSETTGLPWALIE